MGHERLFSRAVIRVAPDAEGEDAAQFLQGLVTNDVTGTLPVYAALLTAQGKMLFDFFVWHALPDAMTWLGAAIIVGSGLYLIHRESVTATATCRKVHSKHQP